MDTPFNFENNRRDGKESNYVKGRNEITNKEHAAEAAHASADKDIQALLEKAISNVGSAKLHSERKDSMYAEHYTDANPVTRQRRYLLEILKKTPELNEQLSDLSADQKEKIRNFLTAIIDDSKVFSLEESFNSDTVQINEKEKPFGRISDLYTVILSQFKENFFTDINVLSIIPEHISVGDSGEITTATFALSLDPDTQSLKFRDTFPDSTTFVISYRYDSDHEKHHDLKITGIKSTSETDNVIELTL